MEHMYTVSLPDGFVCVLVCGLCPTCCGAGMPNCGRLESVDCRHDHETMLTPSAVVFWSEKKITIVGHPLSWVGKYPSILGAEKGALCSLDHLAAQTGDATV